MRSGRNSIEYLVASLVEVSWAARGCCVYEVEGDKSFKISARDISITKLYILSLLKKIFLKLYKQKLSIVDTLL